MTYRNFYRFSQVLIDKTALPAGFAKDFSYQFENYDDFLQILNDQTGCILIGAHVGNWDAAGQFFGNYGSRINIVMLDAEHRRIKNLLDSLHGDKNYKVIALKTDGSHVFEIGKALVDKEYVCFQGDRYMKGAPTLTENLLGAPALFPAGPFQTAGRSGVPVVFFFAMRERKRCYRFLFRVANIDRSATKDKGSESIAEQYVQALEQILHRYPEQWFNYYDFWEEGKAV